jgi:hypothetical protein
VGLLKQVKGAGDLIAMIYVLTIEDPLSAPELMSAAKRLEGKERDLGPGAVAVEEVRQHSLDRIFDQHGQVR